ncbi:MAG: ferritin-like domain-containing protein [Candidatus Peregrinibacteria bacterium]
MGTKGTSIVKMDVNELVELLNKALSDEWLAYYQYWIGSKVVEGAMKGEVVTELVQHSNDELRHAGLLVDRIIQLGGTPVLDPKQWHEKANCQYAAPTDPNVLKVLNQNIEGEQCAIDVYNKLSEITRGKDDITYLMVLGILKDEVEHEDDLQTLLEDIEEMHK